MKEIECGSYYDITDLKVYMNDSKKYKFSWTQDICWDDSDFKDRGKALRQALEDGDTDIFEKLYNEVYANKYFKVNYVSMIHGPGGGWPEADIETDYITVEELFTETYAPDVGGDIYVYDRLED